MHLEMMNLTSDIKYVIEQQGDAYYLFSIVKTNFGGDAKNFIRMSASRKTLEETVKKLSK